MTAPIAAIANFKGGVGKSTTTVMLADGLAYYFGASVLVVDFDPQANSSQMLLTERGIQAAADQGKGLHHLIDQFRSKRPPDAAALVMPNSVTLEELRISEERDQRLGWISSLPAHPILRMFEIDLEENWYSAKGTPSTLASALASHINTALQPLLPIFDVVLIDCPPYLSPLARAALMLADAYVTPTIADAVSAWGTKQFSDWVQANVAPEFAQRSFVVVTRFRNTRYARQLESELRNVYLKDRTFGPTIPESVQALQAMERAAPDSYNTMRGKYGSLRGDVRRLSEDFSAFLGKQLGVPAPPRSRD